MKTLNIVKRNFQISLNMKSSSIILILGPLLLIAIIGFALQDTSLKNIQASTYSETSFQDEFSQSILNKVRENSIQTRVQKDLEQCKQLVKDGEVQLCMELKNPEKNEIGQQNQDVILHVDFSKQRTVWTIIGKVQGIIEAESNQERDLLINDIKNNANEALIEIENQEKKIDEIKIKIDFLENVILPEISFYSQNQKEVKKNINTEIDKMTRNLDDLSEYLEVSQLQPGLLFPIFRNLHSIKTIINQQSLSIDAQINQIDDNLDEIKSQIKLLEDSIDETKEKLKGVNNMDFNRVVDPIQVSYESVSNSQLGKVTKELEFLDYLFPSFLAFFILFNSIIFSATLRLRERKSGAFLRNSLSKYKNRHFIFGDFITSLILISIQSLAIIFIASFFLNLDLISNPTSLIIITLTSVSLFTAIGLAIGSIFDSQESVIISSISISLLFFIFSSLVTPTETLPKAIALLVSITPLTLFETKMRLCMIFGNLLKFHAEEIISLISISIISIATIAFFTKKKREKII